MTKQTQCRSCGEYIVFLTTANGKSIPVDVDTVDEGDQDFDGAKHVTHFRTCPNAEKHRKPRA